MSYTELAGKVFTFCLPDNNKGGCRAFRNEEKFIQNILEIKGCKQIEAVNICGIYSIHFDGDVIDSEIISKVDNIGRNIGFK